MSNKKYQVVVKEEFGSLVLSVTHNGYQWSSIRIDDQQYELPKIINALTKAFITGYVKKIEQIDYQGEE